jgi:hypothetical protein
MQALVFAFLDVVSGGNKPPIDVFGLQKFSFSVVVCQNLAVVYFRTVVSEEFQEDG